MKILFTLTYFEPYISGLTVYVSRMAKALNREGHSVRVICMKHQKDLPEEQNIVRVKPDFKVNKGFISRAWPFETWKEVKQSDVVIVNLPQVEGIFPAVWAKLLGKKLLAVYHCEIQIQNLWLKHIVEMANLVTLFLAEKIVVYTQDYANNAKWLKGYMAKVVAIYPLTPKPGTDRKLELKIKRQIKGRVTIGVAARLAREKGVEFLLKAIPIIKLKLNKKFVILIAGPMDPVGEEDYKSKILKLVQKFKDEVIFLGSIPMEKMGAFYKQINVLVLPSINSTEAFGLVQVEAMKCGVPVVASNLPGVRIPITKTGMGLVVKPESSQEIAEAVLKILKNRGKYSSINIGEFRSKETIESFEKLLL